LPRHGRVQVRVTAVAELVVGLAQHLRGRTPRKRGMYRWIGHFRRMNVGHASTSFPAFVNLSQAKRLISHIEAG